MISLRRIQFAGFLIAFFSTFVFGSISLAKFPVAGGDSQRSGFVDVEGPLTEPQVFWEQGLGIRGISDTQPIIDNQGNLYVTGCPVNYKSWQSNAAPNGALVSLDPDGSERWRFEWTWDQSNPRYQHTWSQLSGPVLAKENLVVMGSRFGMLRCWNRNTGKLLWERKLSAGDDPITSTPVVDDQGFVYVHVRDVPTLRKIDCNTGQYVWVHRFVDGSTGNTSSPTLSHNQKTVYIGRTARSNAYLYAVNASDGSYKWAWSPEVGHGHAFAWSIPVIDSSGNIYIQDEEHAHFYAVKDLGKIHARQFVTKREGKGAPRLLATNDEAVFSSYNNPAMVITALDRTGKELWTREFLEGETAGLIATRKAVYFGANGTGKIYALDATSGRTLWTKQVGLPQADFSEGLTLNTSGVLYAGVNGTAQHPDEATIVALK